jgi:lysophospholipase L1-like esterase
MRVLLVIFGFLLLLGLVLGSELLSQLGRYQAYWNRRNQQAAVENEILYFALGDSTAQGIGATKPDKGYVGVIADELQKRSGRPVRTLNLSKSRATLTDMLQRQLPLLKQCQISKDVVVTIEIGANDMGKFEPEKFERQMDELMSQLPKQTVISDIPYFGGGLHKKLEPNVEKANVIIHNLAEKHGLRMAELHAKTRSNDSKFKNYAFDRFHPTNYNYQTNWAQVFLEQIRLEHDSKF